MSRHREAFDAFAERAKEELGNSLRKLVLYGSVARGEETEESDVDLFAVVETERDRERLMDIAFDVGLEYEVAMSPVVKTTEEFSDMRDTMFGREVQQTGEAVV